MKNKDATYYLSGITYSKDSLLLYCQHQLINRNISSFEKELFTFIIDWFSTSPFITAKTSGSTGQPKEIQLQKKYMTASAEATILYFNLKQKEKILLCLPMSFIAGKMMVVRALVGSLDLYYTEPTATPELPETRIQFSAMVPLQVSNLLKENSEPLLRIEKLIIGGSFISDALLYQIQHLKNRVWQTYGMTETMTHIAARKLNGADATDTYRSLPGSSVSIKKGRIVIHAQHLGLRYLETNDLGEMHENGEFKIVGRADNVIISGGLKFYPEDIERKLVGVLNHDFMIGGFEDADLGQKIVLVLKRGHFAEQDVFNIWQIIEKVLSKHEMPQELIFIPEIHKTSAGKTDRNTTLSNYQRQFKKAK